MHPRKTQKTLFSTQDRANDRNAMAVSDSPPSLSGARSRCDSSMVATLRLDRAVYYGQRYGRTPVQLQRH